MLDGLRTNEIIVGAYSKDGGICPMLAAHRAGGRTNLISFAKAWDRFALGDIKRARPRRATERELRVLRTHLEASLLEDEMPRTELGAAIESHKRLLARRERRHDYGRMLHLLESAERVVLKRSCAAPPEREPALG
jgi:hypothetical protein